MAIYWNLSSQKGIIFSAGGEVLIVIKDQQRAELVFSSSGSPYDCA